MALKKRKLLLVSREERNMKGVTSKEEKSIDVCTFRHQIIHPHGFVGNQTDFDLLLLERFAEGKLSFVYPWRYQLGSPKLQLLQISPLPLTFASLVYCEFSMITFILQFLTASQKTSFPMATASPFSSYFFLSLQACRWRLQTTFTSHFFSFPPRLKACRKPPSFLVNLSFFE